MATPASASRTVSAWAVPPRRVRWQIRSHNCPRSHHGADTPRHIRQRRRSAGVNSCTYKGYLLHMVRHMGYTLLLLFTAQGQPDSPDRVASVRGVVTNSATGEGLRKTHIRLASIG